MVISSVMLVKKAKNRKLMSKALKYYVYKAKSRRRQNMRQSYALFVYPVDLSLCSYEKFCRWYSSL